MEPKNIPSTLSSGRTGKKDGGEFSLLVTQLSPHPNPLPRGEGVYLQTLGALELIFRLECRLPSRIDLPTNSNRARWDSLGIDIPITSN